MITESDTPLEHPVLTRITKEGFTPLGWFAPDDMGETKFVILIGNAGPQMFQRFQREDGGVMDEWTKRVVDPLAAVLGAQAAYPFDKPHLPFLSWARRGGAGHISPLGLNIHPTYGLWHAYRAALLFPVQFDLPLMTAGQHPCETCVSKPCLSACPVEAFDGQSYDVGACGTYLKSGAGENCMTGGCLARRACPVGKGFQYLPAQAKFHMRAFLAAR